MKTAKNPAEGISKGVLVLLLIWFFVFAIGDFVTTFWLILHDPAGISNEGNPFAASLFNGGGFIYLIMAKLGICVAIELLVIFMSVRYSHIHWFKSVLEATLLTLITYSLIIIYNNFLAIITINAILAPNLLKYFTVTETGALILTLIISNLILYLAKTKQTLTYIEANASAIVLLGPLALWRPFFQWYLMEQPMFYFAYLGSVLAVLATAFYISDEIVEHRGLRAKTGK